MNHHLRRHANVFYFRLGGLQATERSLEVRLDCNTCSGGEYIIMAIQLAHKVLSTFEV